MAIDPNIKKKADDIRNKIYGKEVRESLASGLEEMSTDVVETVGRQNEVEGQWQNVVDETTGKDVISAPEIIAARDGESNLKARLDKEKNEVTDQLAQNTTKISNFQKEIVEEDDSYRLERAINHSKENGNSLIIDENISIKRTVYIDDDISLISKKGITIEISTGDNYGFIIEGNNNKILNSCFDGLEQTARLIHVVNSKNIFIAFSCFKNGYSETTSSSAIYALNSERIIVEHNSISNFISKDDGIIGNPIGSSRGVWFAGVKQGKIKNNFFENIGSAEDGDSIHVQDRNTSSVVTNDTSCEITDNLIVDVAKRGIKLQAPNNIVKHNKIYSERVGNTTSPTSGISNYSYNNTILYNLIDFKRGFSGLDLLNSSDSIVSFNTIFLDASGEFVSSTTNNEYPRAILPTNVDNVSIENNQIHTKDSKINGSNIKNSKINNNFLSEGVRVYINLTDLYNTSIENNELQTDEETPPYTLIQLTDFEKVKISGNHLGLGTICFRLQGDAKETSIEPNVFNHNQSENKYRVTDLNENQLENIEFIGVYQTGQDSIPKGETNYLVPYSLGLRHKFVAITPTYRNMEGGYHITSGGSVGFRVNLDQPQAENLPFIWKAEL